MVALLLAELQAYKSLRGPTGLERYNVLCDLLGMWDPQGVWDPPRLWDRPDPAGIRDKLDLGRSLARAVALLELAQLLCCHSFAPHTDWWVLLSSSRS